MRQLDRGQLAALLDLPIFHTIGETADEKGMECYVVGGYVRDLFLEGTCRPCQRVQELRHGTIKS